MRSYFEIGFTLNTEQQMRTITFDATVGHDLIKTAYNEIVNRLTLPPYNKEPHEIAYSVGYIKQIETPDLYGSKTWQPDVLKSEKENDDIKYNDPALITNQHYENVIGNLIRAMYHRELTRDQKTVG